MRGDRERLDLTSSGLRGWRAPLVALALLVVAVGSIAVATTSSGDGAHDGDAAPAMVAAATSTPTSTPSTTTTAPTTTTTTTAPAPPTTTTTAATTEVRACTNDEVALDIHRDKAAYTAGDVVRITASITNRSGHECVLPGARELTVRRGGEVVATAAGMADGGAWAAGDVARIELVWDHGEGQAAHEPGSYEATATFTTDAGTSYSATSAFAITAD